MADIFDQRGNATENDGKPAASAGDWETLPKVSRLMVGVWNDGKKDWELPPHSLICWLEGSLLKFLFNAGDKCPRLFGSSSGLEHGLDGVESALANGNCSWKPAKGVKK